MTTTTKSIIALVIAVVAAGGVYGGYKFLLTPPIGGSATGSTFNSAKVAETIMAPVSNSATTSSILNSDTSDRVITDYFVACATSTGAVFAQTAAGVNTFQWTAATTTTSAPSNLDGNSNTIFTINLGTSTTDNSYAASTTNSAKVSNRTWLAGSYITFAANATSSNKTLSCEVGVHYLGS
jgi:hypothetical protein